MYAHIFVSMMGICQFSLRTIIDFIQNIDKK